MSCGCEMSDHLMCTNVGDLRLREKGFLVIIGSCMKTRHPEIVDDFKQRNGGQIALYVCLEETHANKAGFKIGSMVKHSGIKKLTALTVDGSPHCVQLHFLVDDVKRHFVPDVETLHYVVEKDRIVEVSSEEVKLARHLSKIGA
ncbi:MAG: hypothetical protein ACE5H4_00155 [Candidatus Thorarchaeota archaeon]